MAGAYAPALFNGSKMYKRKVRRRNRTYRHAAKDLNFMAYHTSITGLTTHFPQHHALQNSKDREFSSTYHTRIQMQTGVEPYLFPVNVYAKEQWEGEPCAILSPTVIIGDNTVTYDMKAIRYDAAETVGRCVQIPLAGTYKFFWTALAKTPIVTNGRIDHVFLRS